MVVARAKSSMTMNELVELLGEYGQSNSVESIVRAGPYLEALAHTFGDREVGSVRAKELHAFPQTDLYESRGQPTVGPSGGENPRDGRAGLFPPSRGARGVLAVGEPTTRACPSRFV